MSPVYLVVEGPSDVNILRRLLPPAVLKRLQFVVGDGKSSAISAARTLLAIRDRPVGLLVDADTDRPQTIVRERQKITEMLHRAAHGLEYQLFFAVPDLDHIYARHGPANKIPLVRDIMIFVKSNTKQHGLPGTATS